MGRSAVLASSSAAVAASIRRCAAGSAAFFCFGVPGPFRSWGRARSAVASSAWASATVLRAATRAGLVTLRVSGADVHPVVGQRVDAVVRGGVLEHVLDPPAGPQPAQQGRAGGGGVAGQHLQDGRVVLEQGELAGGAVTLDLDGLVGQHHLHRRATAADGCLYRVAVVADQRGPAGR